MSSLVFGISSIDPVTFASIALFVSAVALLACYIPARRAAKVDPMRYRSHLECRQLAPGTINLRLGAVRGLAYEAAECGLLSADLAAANRQLLSPKCIAT
jgi:hypothetical protein